MEVQVPLGKAKLVLAEPVDERSQALPAQVLRNGSRSCSNVSGKLQWHSTPEYAFLKAGIQTHPAQGSSGIPLQGSSLAVNLQSVRNCFTVHSQSFWKLV